MRSVADHFGVSKSTTFQVFYRVCDMLKGYLAAKLITWPIGERLQDITKEFEDMRGMPSVIGAIDGSHIPIKAPVLCPENYINCKGFHSVILQAVCDHRMLFADCYAGWPGSVHDARVFKAV